MIIDEKIVHASLEILTWNPITTFDTDKTSHLSYNNEIVHFLTFKLTWAESL